MSEHFFPRTFHAVPPEMRRYKLFSTRLKKKQKTVRWVTFYFTELEWRFVYCKNQSRCWEISMSFIIYVYC